jgi:hypothetical protein
VCEACGKDIEENGVPAGEVEQGVLNDLGKLPDEASTSSIAKASLKIARVLDSNEISPRDMAPLIKELRQNRAALLSLYPPEEDDDPTETARKNREEFVGSTWEEPWSG